MKKNFAIVLTLIMSLCGASEALASDALTKKYNELTKADFGSMVCRYKNANDADYAHCIPEGFSFTSGVIGSRTADFDGDGAEEMLVFYAEHEKDANALYAQMYEERNSEAVLAAESDKITNFLSGEKGGGCAFIKKVDGKDRIFMQYTGEINSYADGADFQIFGLDYNGSAFEKAFEFSGSGSMYTITEDEAEEFKTAGLTDTFAFFSPYDDEVSGEKGYGFSPYYGGPGNEDYGSFNIGALEKEKDMVVDITVSTNVFDIFEIYPDETERLKFIEKDGEITLKIEADTGAADTEKAADGIKILLNGKAMTFDAEPYIENGTTRVPMRAIFEGLGADVDWDSETKAVTAAKGDTVIRLTIGSSTALVNGSESALLVPAEIKSGRTMVPLRFVSEALGARVDWDGDTKTISIANDTETE